MTCMQFVKMKDIPSIFTYMMCRKFYDHAFNHLSMRTYIVFCDFIQPWQKWLIVNNYDLNYLDVVWRKSIIRFAVNSTQNWLNLSRKLVHLYFWKEVFSQFHLIIN